MFKLTSFDKKEMSSVLSRKINVILKKLSVDDSYFCNLIGVTLSKLNDIRNKSDTFTWNETCTILLFLINNKDILDYFNSRKQLSIFIDFYNGINNSIKKKLVQDNIRNERLKILEQTSMDILFEYIPQSDVFKYSYYNEDNKIKYITINDFLHSKLYKNIVHEQSIERFISDFNEIIEKPCLLSNEFLINFTNSSYEWHKLTYNSVCADGIVTNVYGKAENINDLIMDKNSAIKKASIDFLTGINNKAAFFENVNSMLEKNKDKCCALLMIDLDDFKVINDKYGHIQGDHLLQNVASLLVSVFSVDDIIGRFGGDEFVVFIQNIPELILRTKLKMFKSYLDDIRKTLDANISCSIGVSYSNNSNVSLKQLIKMADDAMYYVKKNGKNNYNFKKI